MELQKKIVTDRREKTQLVLSVFHGIDVFGQGFEREGFCVVRAGEIDLGFDIKNFSPVPNRFDGVIGGSPCQDFSKANRTNRTFEGTGTELIKQFERVVKEARPKWFLHENVDSAPNLKIDGYKFQRFYLNAKNCGLEQNRNRKFQFGSIDGKPLIIKRDKAPNKIEPCITVNEGNRVLKERRTIQRFAELQGLDITNESFPYFKLSAKYKILGQSVPLPMARKIAAAIRDRSIAQNIKLCKCNCGEPVSPRRNKIFAGAACRKRFQRQKP